MTSRLDQLLVFIPSQLIIDKVYSAQVMKVEFRSDGLPSAHKSSQMAKYA